ncbi:tetratricopeptide repeat-containing diguanylate cyclase [Flocculibacter collagenilyticus]|uniref:tetratricopeptide repeat-containing diguanylate cyclase n=1 Tax=Flocculibacter collagenilyticus TaxID=2744479 RepID=UPI0018F72063|nr:diguanylate cyclase [Flocculibacter collagenilyticus]
MLKKTPVTILILLSVMSQLIVLNLHAESPALTNKISDVKKLVQKNPEEAIRKAKALNAAKSDSDSDKILLLNIIAEGLMRTGKLEEAMEYAEKSMLLQEVIENKIHILDTYRLIAEIHSLQGAYERVIEISLKGVDQAESTKQFNHLRDFYHEIGIAYFRLSNLESAEKYFNKGYQVSLEHHLTSRRASSLVALAIINREKKQWDQSLAYYDEALNIYQEANNESGMASVYNNIGVIYEDKQEYENMLSSLQQALAIYERLNARDNITIGLLNVGNAYRLLKQYDSALNYLESAKQRAIENNSKLILSNIYEELTNLHINKNDYQTAFEYHIKQDEIINELESVEAKKLAKEMDEKYESAIKERRIQLLEKEKQNDQYLLILISAVCVFILITLVLMLSRNKDKQRFLNEITEKNRKLEILSTTDPLTELPNRRVVFDAINAEIARCNRYGQPFTIIIFDVDHFKKVNDKYGHNGGDIVLKRIANLITQNIRENDLFGRWGGEEFLLVLASTTQSSAMIVAEKLRGLIEAMQIEYEEHTIRITATMGVCEYQLGVKIEDMINTADLCLYEGKEQGRNRVVPAKKL